MPSYTNARKIESDVTSLTFTDYQNQVLNGNPPKFTRRSKSVSNTALARRRKYSTTGLINHSHRSISEVNDIQDKAIIAPKQPQRPLTGIARIFPLKDNRNLYMKFPPNTSLAKLKYRMINRADKRLTTVVDRHDHK